ncbi:hypothetical protein [Streptomyces sp. CAU 1734]|uniref:hypothetical protein n=1 Tax=Streptomyces sp. CAU 1734 TaxID=3140360 RepID=UPI0032611E0A
MVMITLAYPPTELALADYHSAIAARDALRATPGTAGYDIAQAAVDKAARTWEETDGTDRSVFLTDTRALAVTALAMAAVGMLAHGDPPPWPDPADFGITGAAISYRYDIDHDLPEGVLDYLDACDRVLETSASRPLGIPCYKLASPDGWLITPAEIAAALGWFAVTPRDIQRTATAHLPWWPRWIRHLKAGQQHGGLRVG